MKPSKAEAELEKQVQTGIETMVKIRASVGVEPVEDPDELQSSSTASGDQEEPTSGNSQDEGNQNAENKGEEKDEEENQKAAETKSAAIATPQTTRQQPLDDDRMFVPPQDWFAFLAAILLALINLGEAIFTTYEFDEDKFDFWTIAMALAFFAVASTIAKTVAFCTKPEWDDLLVDIGVEGLQAFLYIFFCNYSDEAKLWIPVMMAGQIALTLAVFIKPRIHWCCGEKTDGDGADEESGDFGLDAETVLCISCANKCCMPICIVIMLTLVPISYLFTQEESPFRTKDFEVVMACYLWIVEVGFQAMYDSTTGLMLIKKAHEFEEQAKTVVSNMFMLQMLVIVAVIGMHVYTTVLAYIWWFSPEIEDTYDKVITMMLIVGSACTCCGQVCNCCTKAGGSDFGPGIPTY